MRLKFLAPLVGVLAAFLVTAGAASADTGTFSGSITPTACGPLQPGRDTDELADRFYSLLVDGMRGYATP